MYVSPYHEEDLVALTEALGASQVVFGSDFPHPEGLAEPAEFAEGLAGLSDADIRAIMYENTQRLVSGAA